MTFLNDNDMIEELLTDNKMAEVESSKTMRKELEVFEERHNEIEDIINSSIDPVCAFLNMTDMQEVIEVNVNNVNELTWWLNISTMCFIECNKNINNHDFIHKLKRMLLEYCMETSIYEHVKDNQYGKISLFDGFAYLNVFYFKRVMPSSDEVINGERNYRDIYRYFEDNKSCTLMQHEAYPFIEISDPKSSLLDKSKYENFYKKVFDSKDDNLDSYSIANQLKLIHESIVKIETASLIQNKWKSLLLTYTSEEIMINTNVVTETVKETNVTEEEKLNITEKLLIFHYLTGYSNNELKDFSIRYGGINVNSISKPLGRIMDFKCNKMSSKQLEQYKPSLEKVKNQLSSQKITEKIQTAINEVDNDIIKCDERIETTKIEEEKAKEEKRKKFSKEIKHL